VGCNNVRTSRAILGRALVIALFAIGVIPCLASDVAMLKNGFSIKHERREIVGDVTRLYVSADGSSFVDVPTAEIDHFEAAPPEATSSLHPASASRSAPGSGASGSGISAHSAADLSSVVNEASGRYRLDPDLVNSVIKAESDFNPHAVSPKGAQGLMQLMPGTASQLGVPNTFDPAANVEGGTKYLRELLEKYNFDLVKALAAYNAGPQRVERFGGVPPYYETRAYVARIVKDFNKKKIARQKAAASKSATAKPATATASAESSSGSRKSGAVKAESSFARSASPSE
jgi:septal ring-binding cell division protein DamX